MLTRPPLGPPCFSARALSSAAVAAAQRPRTQRRPLVHALLLFSSDAPRLFAYAREVLDIFANHGIDIYLQTDVRSDNSTLRTLIRAEFAHADLATGAALLPVTKVSDSHSAPRPITTENVDDILAASQFEFVILVTEQNIARRTIQVRVGTQFVEREIEKHANLILDAWASTIERELKQEHQFSLGMNPNVVTNKHIDFLLQQHPRLGDIRTAYAALARLVNRSQKWLVDEDEQCTHSSVQAPIQQEDGSSLGSPTTKSTESTEKSDQADILSQPVSEGSEISKDEMEKLSKKALSEGLKAVLASSRTEIDDDLDVLKKTNLSISWLKRSGVRSARLLRGQFLVRSIHSRLVDTYPVISSAPVVRTPEQKSGQNFSVPSEAHRQRLLREVNFLISRMEEIGSRLSRRPKTRRRQRMTGPVNPWSTYINRSRSAVATFVNSASSDDNGYYCSSDQSDSWTCIGCHSNNRRSMSCCRSCKAPSCVLERGLLPDASEAMANRVREAIKSSAIQRMPWIFAPSPTAVSPPTTTSAVPIHGNLGRRPETAPFTINPVTGSNSDPIRIPQVVPPSTFRAPGRKLSPDVLDGFRSISVDDGIPNGHSAHILYETPSRSPETVRGHLSGLSQFPATNGGNISKVNAIPIARPRNLEGSPPSRSPGAADYRSNMRSRISDEVRAASLDASMLGNGVHRTSNQWFGCENPLLSRTPQSHVGNADALLGRSPPLFGSVNGTSSSAFELRIPRKGSICALGDNTFSMNSGRNTAAPRSFDHFSNAAHMMMSGNGMFPARNAHSVSHMEELAVGSIEAQNFPSRYMTSGVQNVFPPLGSLEQRSSLEDLAAASDAANGGLGSATTESLRAVMALRTDFDRSNNDRESGGYGYF